MTQRSSVRRAAGSVFIFPVNADTDKTRTDSSASGTASTSASAMPAVAMATVRQVSLATSSKNSPSTFGGKKSLKNLKVGFKLPASNSVQTLNSVSTSAGHSSTVPASSQNKRPNQAGSRLLSCVGSCEITVCISGSASQQEVTAHQAHDPPPLQGHPTRASAARTSHASAEVKLELHKDQKQADHRACQ